MENNSNLRHTNESAPAAPEDASTAGQGLPADVLGACLADLKRQIAMRMAMA